MNPKKKARVLIVDDDPATLCILSEFLAARDYLPHTARDGDQALELFLEKAFDLILTDQRMPGMDGVSLSLRIKEISPDTPIVMMTGDLFGKVKDLLEGGILDSIVYKPFSLKEMQEALEQTLSRMVCRACGAG